MCGISVILRSNASRDRVAHDLERMWPGIASRGPDGRGEHAAPGVGLGHARLAIIDLATGDQPIWNERRTVCCVYNGEIYNYRALRKQLAARGHQLATSSDTEVLVHLYEDHGRDLTRHIHGMYAFAIYDFERRALLLGRDRFGQKPLYLAEFPGGLAAASSLASLLALDDVSRDVDPDAIAEYLQFSKVAEPRTAFRSVRALLPGHTLEVDARTGASSPARFYRVETPSPVRARPADAVALARQRFEESVESHLIADVEVGAFLSGGIDSTLIVAQAQRITGRPLRTFSVAFGGEAVFDESAHAERVARHLGTRHETLHVDGAPIELVRTALEATGQPFAIASFLPMLMLSQAAARHVKVVLTGDGGDEVGLGYPWYRWMRWTPGSRAGGTLRALSDALRGAEVRASANPRLRLARRALKFGRGAVLGGAGASDSWRYDVTAEEARSLLRPELRPDGLQPSPTALAWRPGTPPVEALQIADIEVLLRDEMLPKLDRAGMAYGLEGRPPLLDDAFVEAMLAVPASSHLEHREGKALLRRWARELCPVVDAQRPKHGFDVPMHRWLQGPLREDVERLLLHPTRPGLMDPPAARRLWARMSAGAWGPSHTLFAMLVAELWFEALGTQ